MRLDVLPSFRPSLRNVAGRRFTTRNLADGDRSHPAPAPDSAGDVWQLPSDVHLPGGAATGRRDEPVDLRPLLGSDAEMNPTNIDSSTSFGFLSTYPPTQCGLATFTESLAFALRDGPRTAEIGVVRIVEHPEPIPSAEVVHHLLNTGLGEEAAAAAALDHFDLAIIQHEYGIYGGDDGDTIIEILRRLHVPSIVVLHTVLGQPSSHQRVVLEQVARAASVIVVMTATAKQRLLDGYRVDPAKITVIAHGAPTDWGAIERRHPGAPPLVLTWGLLGPGKGIEWAVTALAGLADLDPAPRYVVAGETHPQVLEHSGESYREMLAERAESLGVRHLVHFDNRYLDRRALRELVAAADVVVLPYDSTDQVTSGVLIEAVTAGRPVVATAFPHAVELLSSGAGTIVAHRDAPAITAALRRILTEPTVASAMIDAAECLVPDLTWAAVAGRYWELADRLPRAATAVSV